MTLRSSGLLFSKLLPGPLNWITGHSSCTPQLVTVECQEIYTIVVFRDVRENDFFGALQRTCIATTSTDLDS